MIKSYQFNFTILILSFILFQCSNPKEKKIKPGKYHVIGYEMGELNTDNFEIDMKTEQKLREKTFLGEIIGAYDTIKNSRDFDFEKDGELKVYGNNQLTHQIHYKLKNDSTFILINKSDSVYFKIEKLNDDTLILYRNQYKKWIDFKLNLKRVE